MTSMVSPFSDRFGETAKPFDPMGVGLFSFLDLDWISGFSVRLNKDSSSLSKPKK